MRKKPLFANNEIYHVYNRGVEKRKIFLEDRDFETFLYYLSKCNCTKKIRSKEIEKRERLVDILGFVLMDNHFHLVLRQKIDGGIVKFMHKLETAYAMRFNKKYDRVGHLIQGNFKAVSVTTDEQFSYLLYYIHLNPLDKVSREWRSGFLRDFHQAMTFLYEYKWSSLTYYVGFFTTHFFLSRDNFLVEEPKKYRKNFEEYMKLLSDKYEK